MMRKIGLLLACVALSASPALAQSTWDNPRVERLAWPELDTFASEREYRNWVRDVRRMQRQLQESQRAALDPEIVVALANVEQEQELPPECDPLFGDCGGEDGTIVVSGARAPSASQSTPLAITSITNNQVGAVDEGDIVKRIGDYLLVLQDGRIFAANFRTMQLTDRMDVYRRDEDGDPIGADWYDEMLVQGDHILVTAYSYYDEASELSVFRLDRETGRLERRGVFLISSEDYYDIDNYATRVVGDRLVIYTPYDPEDLVNRRNRPVVRRWVPSANFDDEGRGEPMLDSRNIYRPVFGTFEPTVHTISICDLGELEGDSLDCESSAFIAGNRAEMFVSPDNIYLATTASSWNDQSTWQICRSREAGFASASEAAPGAVFRIPLRRNAEVDLLPVRGVVFDQFSMDQQGSRFRMLESWNRITCGNSWREHDSARGDIELIDASIASFNTTYRTAPERLFTKLPAVEGGYFENRFVGEWLLYGVRSRYGRPPEEDDEAGSHVLMTVPLASPETARELPLGHEITRIEALGTDAIATGYRDQTGLHVSYLDLADAARLADQVLLTNRYESESRSHAFNATIYPEADGLLGLPTVRAEDDSSRWWWRSDNSAISFLRFSDTGQLTDLADVASAEGSEEAAEGYSCEVSCVDWYGNARPIFIDRGVYALMGTELVEGRALEDRVEMLRRLDLTAPPAR